MLQTPGPVPGPLCALLRPRERLLRARYRPFGRVSLAPPLPSVAARSAARRHRSHDRCVLLTPALRAALVAVPASPRTRWRTTRRSARCTRARAPAERSRTSLRTASCTGCPHQCGHRRRRLRLRPHRPPLIRRGGSTPPASPASIPRTLMQQVWPSRPPGAALGLTLDAPVVHGAHGCPCLAFGALSHDPSHSCPRLSCRK